MATATHLLTPEEAHADLVPENVVVRFAGDSGDGMQLTGGQFTLSTALAGNLLAQAPVGGANALNIVCNDILNGNASGNNVAVDIAGLPGLPEIPIELPEVPTS